MSFKMEQAMAARVGSTPKKRGRPPQLSMSALEVEDCLAMLPVRCVTCNTCFGFSLERLCEIIREAQKAGEASPIKAACARLHIKKACCTLVLMAEMPTDLRIELMQLK